jgi:hypothetical protein
MRGMLCEWCLLCASELCSAGEGHASAFVYYHYGDLTAAISKGFSLSSKVSRLLRTAGPFPRSLLQLLQQRWRLRWHC